MRKDFDLVAAAAAAVADDGRADWAPAHAGSLPHDERDLLRQLRIISALGRAHRSDAADPPESAGWPRVAVALLALAIAITPMLTFVIASAFVPALEDPRWRKWIGLGLCAALIPLVPTTLYAVAVQRLTHVEFRVRKTLPHTLARTIVRAACVGPLLYLIVSFYRHREIPILELFTGDRSIGLVVCAMVGLGVLTFRHDLLRRVDRWFRSAGAEYPQVLAQLERLSRTAKNSHDIARLLLNQIDEAVNPTVSGMFVVNEGATQLRPVAGAIPAPEAGDTLVDLVRSAQTEIQLNPCDGPIVRLLPASDREWLINSGIHVLFPLLGSTGTLLGIVALGQRRNGVPYTVDDRILITALTGAASLNLENRWLRDPSTDERADRSTETPAVASQEEPAVYCPTCGTVWSAACRRCRCEVAPEPAALPLVVHGKFRVERFIGSGGMGVVYLAVDLTLDRKIAIKTLTTMNPERAIGLRREARAMAAVVHPNLALIYGAEYWRGTPLLIVEYLEGGTLADRLRHGPLSVEEVIDLGVLLADALDRVHDSGLVHRDIKPSNIGYTRDGVPKLLDFGLATILDGSSHIGPSSQVTDDSALDAATFDRTPTVTTFTRGTPLYLAPEAVVGEPPHVSSDLWSLSVVLYEAIAGQHPLAHSRAGGALSKLWSTPICDIRARRHDCPASVATFFEEALSPSLGRRLATASELRDRLQILRANLNAH